MKYALLVLTTVIIAGAAYSAAQAGSNCTTTCQRGAGGSQTCNTHCY